MIKYLKKDFQKREKYNEKKHIVAKYLSRLKPKKEFLEFSKKRKSYINEIILKIKNLHDNIKKNLNRIV